ncbi:GPI transamidase component PIG-S-like [Amphiura filiformis]|uniref:GPI transamidase component PIG-S-like n=1 Tax=Amphiura filiformis TaxID=82378 RepID=UPI003B220771
MGKNKAKKDDKDGGGEEHNQMYSALAIGLVCIVIGLPLWWKTTTTYRASLPYSEIDTLAQTQMQYKVPVNIRSCLSEPSTNENNILKQLQEKLNQDNPNSKVSVQYSINVRKCNPNDLDRVHQHQNLQELDRSFLNTNTDTVGHPVIYLLSGDHKGFQGIHTYIGKQRISYVAIHKDDLSNSLDHVVQLLRTTLVNELSMVKICNAAQGFQHTQADAGTMRAVRSTPGYGISFSLLNPQPDVLDVKWDIRQAIQDYLEPFTQKLDEFANFVVDSQVLYYTGISVKPKQSEDKSYYYLSQGQLPQVITPVEAKLGSHVSTYPSLNFLLYVPKRNHAPLYVVDAKGDQVSTNAFLSPRWGGVMVYNVQDPTNNTELPAEVMVNMHSAMEVFLSQLRLLIGIPAQSQGGVSNVHIEQPGASGVTDWEYDVLLRGRTLENIATASATLVSLSQLLDKIGNIVINDDIAQQVYKAVESVNQGHAYLQQGNLYRAFHASKRAIAASEKAFFDPSLLELLYFPDDQKFAIYIPLFLPISIPVFASLFKVVKWFRARRKTKQD